jgi:alpha-tubulin suppressor-like RCC1 family protein
VVDGAEDGDLPDLLDDAVEATDEAGAGCGNGSCEPMEDQVSCPADCGAVEISAGPRHTCVRLADGTLRCWGANDRGQLGDGTTTGRNVPAAVAGVSRAVDVSAGGVLHGLSCGPSPCFPGHSPHSCAALADGTVRCWGTNGQRQLGDGTTTDASLPVSVSGLTGATAVASGAGHSCAFRADGTIACWGANDFGQLGDGTTSDHALPVPAVGLTGATSVSTGPSHSCAVTSDGTVACWGGNETGQLGDGTTTNRSTPGVVPGLARAVAVSAGGGWHGTEAEDDRYFQSHTCAVTPDGGVWCWGSNNHGQLGDGTTTDRLNPVRVVGVTGVVAVAAGGFHTCALTADGDAWCWGRRDEGQLGEGALLASDVPVAVAGLTDVVEVAASDQTLARRSDGTVWRWGGGAGNVPRVVPGLSDVLALSGACALLVDGTVQCLDDDGLPEVVAGVAGAVSVTDTSWGMGHMLYVPTHVQCAALRDGTAVCWNGAGEVSPLAGAVGLADISGLCGLDSSGSVWCSGTGLGDGVTDVVGLSSSPIGHSCAVRRDGTVLCWGRHCGALGDGTETEMESGAGPLVPTGLPPSTEVSAGGNHCNSLMACRMCDCSCGSACALQAEGTVWCWGRRALLPAPVPGIDGATSISDGERHRCAVLRDRTVVCWGDNSDGQLGDGGPFPTTGLPIQVASW